MYMWLKTKTLTGRTRINCETYLLRIMFQRLQFPTDTTCLMQRLSRHITILIAVLEAAIVAAGGWVERLNSGMTSRLGAISHALVASSIVMRILSRECR